MRHTIALLGILTAAAWLTGLRASQPVAAQAAEPHLSAHAVGAQVFIDFAMNPSRTDDLAQRLRSGLPVSVLWRLQTRLDVRRWRDASGPDATVRVSARPRPDGQGFVVAEVVNGVVERTVTRDNIDRTIVDLTSFTNIPAFRCDALASGHSYSIAIRAILDGGGAARIETAGLATTVFSRPAERPHLGFQQAAAGTVGGRCG